MTHQKHNEFEERVIEQLAELEHQQWVEWAITIMKQEPISEERRERWMKYLCGYGDLPEEVKEHDRKWARQVYKVVEEAIREAQEERYGREEFKKCPQCKKYSDTVRTRICGYIEDVHGEKVEEYCCDDCEEQHLLDV